MSETFADEALVKLARGGDGEALSALLVRFSRLVSLRAAAFRCEMCEQEDLEQEGLIAVLSAVRGFDPARGVSFRTYVGECVDNRMISFIRTSSRQNRLRASSSFADGAYGGEEIDPEDLIIGKEGYDDIMAAVTGSLSDYEKNVLALYVEGLSYAEMGERFNKSAKSVGNALARVRAKLYELLKQ